MPLVAVTISASLRHMRIALGEPAHDTFFIHPKIVEKEREGQANVSWLANSDNNDDDVKNFTERLITRALQKTFFLF